MSFTRTDKLLSDIPMIYRCGVATRWENYGPPRNAIMLWRHRRSQSTLESVCIDSSGQASSTIPVARDAEICMKVVVVVEGYCVAELPRA